MATLNMTLSPNPVVAGQTVTATYSISGADDEPASSRVISVDGTATVDGEVLDVDIDMTVSKPAVVHTKSYQAPTAPGMTFNATSNPLVWTAVAPSS